MWLRLLIISLFVMAPLEARTDSTRASRLKTLGNLEEMFVSRWAWSSVCDYTFANNHDGSGPGVLAFDPVKVESGSSIFVTYFCLEQFFAEIHPKIKNPYILVTLYCGAWGCWSKYINDPKLIAWFGMGNNDSYSCNKFVAIPLGVYRDERVFAQRAQINKLFKKLRTINKAKLLYMNFTRHQQNVGNRNEVYDLFKDQPFCVKGKNKPFVEYMKDSGRCKFVLSPLGDIPDCYRHWEALLSGSIPIVQKSEIDPIFADLPVVIVDDYKDVTKDFLLKKYQESQGKKFNYRKLYMQYWADKLDEVRAAYFASSKVI